MMETERAFALDSLERWQEAPCELKRVGELYVHFFAGAYLREYGVISEIIPISKPNIVSEELLL